MILSAAKPMAGSNSKLSKLNNLIFIVIS